MKRSASSNSIDSLELLLDTICNTFGAVIFISMLVALLAGKGAEVQPEQESQKDAAVESARVAAEIQAAKEKIRVLTDQLEQQELISEHFSSRESLELAGKLKRSTNQRVQLADQKSEAVEAITSALGQSAELQQQLDRQQAQYDAAESRNETLRQDLAEQIELAGRTAKIPQVRKTDKKSLVYAIDDGNLYRVTTPQETIDNTDCERSTEAGVAIIRPRVGAGVSVATQGSSLRDKFKGASSKTNFIQVFVSRDSFAAFLPVKDTLVELGLEYEVLIAETDEVKLGLGASERESFVQ